jgi:hypothetical protein
MQVYVVTPSSEVKNSEATRNNRIASCFVHRINLASIALIVHYSSYSYYVSK